MIDFSTQFELVIRKNSLGFVVYDNKTKMSIDVFPDTEEGFKRLMAYLEEVLLMESLTK